MVVPYPNSGQAGVPGVTPKITGTTLATVGKVSPKPTAIDDPAARAKAVSAATRKPSPIDDASARAKAVSAAVAPKKAAPAKGAAPAAGAPTGSAPAAGNYVRDQPRAPFSNPNIHPLAETTFDLGMNAKIQRGVMVRLEEVVGDEKTRIPPAQRYQFRFLYNPESVATSTNVFQGLVPPGYADPADTFKAKFVGQETLSFGLMIDRTQEVYEQGAGRTRGTMPDIEALYKVVNGTAGISAGFLFLSTVEVHWSRTANNSMPKFVGYVTSLNVTHTKFTPYMTPIRSLVDVSMARISGTGASAALNNYRGAPG